MTPLVLSDAAIHCMLWGTNGLIRRNGGDLRWSGGRLKRWVLLIESLRALIGPVLYINLFVFLQLNQTNIGSGAFRGPAHIFHGFEDSKTSW